MEEVVESVHRRLTRQISDLMTLGGATLTERQEDMLFFALRTLLDEGGKDPRVGGVWEPVSSGD